MFRISIVVAGVLALVAAPAEAGTAHFKVSFRAVQDVEWTEEVTTVGCGGLGKFGFHGAGRSRIVLRTRRPRPVALRELVMWNLPVTGTFSREGESSGWVIEPGDAHKCGAAGESWAPDCGTRAYPAAAQLQVQWLPPERWMSDPAPLAPALRVIGPFTPGETWLAFRNCKGFDLAGALGVLGAVAPDTGAGTLRPLVAFGRAKRFTVRGHAYGTYALTSGVLTGARTVTTTLDWAMRFTRVRRPRPSAPR
jgi:hypothetical protein